jgi:glycosyltransferase involved in cell wall biosynthesis
MIAVHKNFQVENSTRKNCGIAQAEFAESNIGTITKDITGNDKPEEVRSLNELLKKYFQLKKKKPVIAFYSDVWNRGGIERVISILSDYLKDEYTIVVICSYEENFQNGYVLSSDVFHFKIKAGSNYYSRLLSLINALNIDIFIGNPNHYEDFLDFYQELSKKKIITIAINHGYYFLPLWLNWLHPVYKKRRTCFQKIDAVVWITSFGYNLYKYQFGNGVYIPNPICIDANNLKSSSLCNNRIICVGRFNDILKRFDRILTVFDLVIRENSQIELLVVGDLNKNIRIPPDNRETIGEMIYRFGINDKQIVFAGEQKDVEPWYQKSDLLLMTSDNEGFGMVILEAAAYGIPSIIFEIPGLEDIITDGVNGYIVPQDNFEEMSIKITQFFSNYNLRKEMGQKANEMVKRYDISVLGKKWDLLLKTLLSNKKTDPGNRFLTEDFYPYITDYQLFCKKIIAEYERNIIRIIDYNKNHLYDVQSIKFTTLIKLIIKKVLYKAGLKPY